ncbi:3-hydroxyacyl-CoA dehydrogenase family protein [Bacillus sp. OK048]|uniref:3-hydroxyacyl-CoA dehydrogenase family protein n=1 Tax=Bacillus sp. OK048 TaxID=1882761 RepID=UPI000AD2DF1B|nr:3-hydroxyacyl-CoA dehydrogenase NAD-binding domain-containing protein [Bacillus sp. OK048]
MKKENFPAREADRTLGRIHGTIHIEELADIVIEAIIENMESKKSLLQRLDTLCRPNTNFASNTSGLSITELGNCTNHPSQVIGMHFLNPVPVMKLVETPAVRKPIKRLRDCLKSWGKRNNSTGCSICS